MSTESINIKGPKALTQVSEVMSKRIRCSRYD